jgi:phage tail-like protein
MNNLPSDSSDYIQYLPAILQADPFLQRFLLAFEQILTGIPTSVGQFPGILEKKSSVGLEAVLDEIQTYFNPLKTPAEFLPWLAGWVALSLRDDWDERTKRIFVQQIAPLYQLRGTREGLKQILSLYLRSASISDKVDIFEGAGYPPHYFQVQLILPRSKQSDYWRQVRIARAIIEQEKPAHTYYALRILTPAMRLTGNRYDFPRPATAATEVSVKVLANSQQTAPIPLRVSIKAVGIVDPLATAIAYVSTSTAANLTSPTTLPALFVTTNTWYVLIDNLSTEYFKGTLTVKAATETLPLLSGAVEVEPGLRLRITDKDGNTEGNTYLGTQVGENSGQDSRFR